MGEIRKYSCDCGYTKEVPVGVGVSGMNPAVIRHTFPEDVLAPFFQENEAGNISDYVLQNQLGVCLECHSLVVAPCFQYTLMDGTKKYIMGVCPECGKKFTPAQNPDDICCPRCGKPMAFEPCGHWD